MSRYDKIDERGVIAEAVQRHDGRVGLCRAPQVPASPEADFSTLFSGRNR